MKKLAFLLLFAVACSRDEPPRASLAAPQQPAASERERGAQDATASAMPRMIVRTAEMRIIVADTSKAVAAVTKSVESAGGYVSGSNIWREGELLRARLTLRVPANQLTTALASIRAQAKRVENETITSEDVVLRECGAAGTPAFHLRAKARSTTAAPRFARGTKGRGFHAGAIDVPLAIPARSAGLRL